MRHGRATIRSFKGDKSLPCDNCQQVDATMYAIGLALKPCEYVNIEWVLCVTCRSHLVSLCEQWSRSSDNTY